MGFSKKLMENVCYEENYDMSLHPYGIYELFGIFSLYIHKNSLKGFFQSEKDLREYGRKKVCMRFKIFLYQINLSLDSIFLQTENSIFLQTL